MKRKIKPGRCGICGQAVIIPTVKPHDKTFCSGDYGFNNEIWASGHLFDADDKLVMVRCRDHKDLEKARWKQKDREEHDGMEEDRSSIRCIEKKNDRYNKETGKCIR